jgi:hypothetical protein
MNNYWGITPEDPALAGGGEYIKEYTGRDVGDFAPVKGRVRHTVPAASREWMWNAPPSWRR